MDKTGKNVDERRTLAFNGRDVLKWTVKTVMKSISVDFYSIGSIVASWDEVMRGL